MLANVMGKEPQKQPSEVRLDVLVLSGNNGAKVAQCLQHDITVQAPTFKLMCERFVRAVQLHLAEDEELDRPALSTVPQAPRRFWDMFVRGDSITAKQDVPIFVPSKRNVRTLDVRATFASVEAAAVCA
jgi:hypothetical protein